MEQLERRDFPRLDLSVFVQYRALGHIDNVIYIAKSRNFSVSGLGLILNDKFSVGTVLGLNFLLPDSQEMISATGKIVWIKEIPVDKSTTTPPYNAGIEFICIEETDRQKISQYIQQEKH